MNKKMLVAGAVVMQLFLVFGVGAADKAKAQTQPAIKSEQGVQTKKPQQSPTGATATADKKNADYKKEVSDSSKIVKELVTIEDLRALEEQARLIAMQAHDIYVYNLVPAYWNVVDYLIFPRKSGHNGELVSG